MEIYNIIKISMTIFLITSVSLVVNYLLYRLIYLFTKHSVVQLLTRILLGILLTYILLSPWEIRLINSYIYTNLTGEPIITILLIWWSLVLLKAFDVILWKGYFYVDGICIIPKVVIKILNVLILFSSSIILLKFVYQVDITEVLVASGFIAFIIGYGAQATMADVLGGIALAMARNIRINDWVKVDGITGRVVNMDWRSISLVGYDQNLVVIPNSKFSCMPFVNYSRPKKLRRVSLELKIPYQISPDELKTSAMQVANAMSSDFDRSKELEVFYIGHENNYNIYSFGFYNYSPYSAGLKGEFISALYYKFKRENKSLEAPSLISVDKTPKIEDTWNYSLVKQKISSIQGKKIFNAKEIDIIIKESEMLLYGSQEVVLDEGIICQSLYYLISGNISVRKTHKQKLVEIIRLESESELESIFGEISFLLGIKTTAKIIALTECSILVVPHRTIRKLVNQRPKLLNNFENLVKDRMENTESFIQQKDEDDIKNSLSQKQGIFNKIKKILISGGSR